MTCLKRADAQNDRPALILTKGESLWSHPETLVRVAHAGIQLITGNSNIQNAGSDQLMNGVSYI
jgi:hypothetical protein